MAVSYARVLEPVDNLDLKSSERKLVRVRVPPRAPERKSQISFYCRDFND